MWNSQLELVAQRWTDQCQEGHDSERCKLDGSPVGQNAWQQMETMEEDEAAVQAEWSTSMSRLDPTSEELLRQLSYAIKNQLGHPKL